MGNNDGTRSSWPGPFGMGRQGYLVIAIVILVTARFAATRSDWTSIVVGAIVPPLIIFPILFAVSRLWQEPGTTPERSTGPGEGMDLMTFLARINPLMFLMFSALSRRSDDERYQQLRQSGPYGMGAQ